MGDEKPRSVFSGCDNFLSRSYCQGLKNSRSGFLVVSREFFILCGSKFLGVRKHTVYVDQSGKVGNNSMHTGLAFSDEKGHNFTNAVFIHKRHKKRLKKLGKQDLGSATSYKYKLFSAGVYMLIQNDLHRIKEVRIDKEYEGKKNMIRTYLYNFIKDNSNVARDKYPKIETCMVHDEVNSPQCHELAYDVREKNLEHFLESDLGFLKYLVLRSNK